MNPVISVAQFGCGYWGPNLLRNFNSLPGCRVQRVVEPSEARQGFLRANFPGLAVTSDWQDALRDPAIQAVVIATPAATHFELARAALAAGKHAFVEKPMAMSVREVDELAALAAKNRLTVMAGHTFLYNHAVRHVRELIDRRDLGDINYMYCQRLNLGQVRSDVNAWWNLAPHDVSIFLYWMKDELPVSVAAHGVSYIQPGIEDVVFATLTWASGVVGQVHVSWLDPKKVRAMTVVGTRKMAIYDDVGENKIAIVDKGIDRVPRLGEKMDYDQANTYNLRQRNGDIVWPHLTLPEPLRVEAEHFLECIRTGQPALTGPAHARNVVGVLAAGQQSLKAGGRSVKVADVMA